ncbi:hypothetical protein E3O47_07460 [Cryobacterium sp. TMT2-17-1]|uniref:hypothetical protein n=1 Tax=Cryobacterium sp. TMT2-17-1 TaxID=1259248 RepID=UPI00106BDC24|nr:hypothetical protein [Cryobacterium sp. TMT2-17-1]TFC51558.1 hypothetical protein E3O47_07460 [Cryobacterium sp. TMT2-17-1]
MSRASLPMSGYTAPSRTVDPNTPLVVKVIAEGSAATSVFDFRTLPVSVELQTMFAMGFVAITGPGGNRRTIPSASTAFYDIRAFARMLAEINPAPTKPSDLRASHVDSLQLRKGSGQSIIVTTLRALFRKIDVAPDEFMRRLLRAVPNRPVVDPVYSFSREEFRLVMYAARQTIRFANARIYRARGIIADHRRGLVLPDLARQKDALYLSSLMDRGGFPRTKGGQVSYRGLSGGSRPADLMRALHLTNAEVGALIALLVGLTGQNLAQIVTLPATYHRADKQADGATPTALVRASKPRRGPTRSEMTIPLTGIPTWIVSANEARAHADESDRIDLHSPFGVYMAAMDLGSYARKFADSERLLVFHSVWRRTSEGRSSQDGFREAEPGAFQVWAASTDILDSKGNRIQPETRRLRLTFIEHKQKPVAQGPSTFINQYLMRNRGDIAEYQRVVSDVLDSEVARAEGAVTQILSSATVLLAETDPLSAALVANTTPETLARALAGELDTVMNSCIDHEHSPYSPPGSPCGASFMLCLGCPNARAEPRHLPIQLLVFAVIETRRAEMQSLAWATRFALPHARLTHLFAQFPAATVEAARGKETEGDKALVERFLGRELDIS